MLLIKGFLIGIGKIIPGVSGSLIAISLGLYEKMIDAFVNLFKNFKKNSLFLFKILIGILLAVISMSNLFAYLLKNYYLYTLSLFIGLIIGIVPSILKEMKIINVKYILLPFILIFITLIEPFDKFNPTLNIIDLSIVFFLGILEAVTMIIPGISGTALYIMLGTYEFILSLFSNPFSNFTFTIIFGNGLVVGVIFISKIINYLLKKHHLKMYNIILGFTLFTIFFLIKNIVEYLNIFNFFISFFLIIIGFIISKKFS